MTSWSSPKRVRNLAMEYLHGMIRSSFEHKLTGNQNTGNQNTGNLILFHGKPGLQRKAVFHLMTIVRKPWIRKVALP